MSALRFTGWLPIGLAPASWEGKTVFWRDNRDAPFKLREIPRGFSRSALHCGAIEVAGIEGENPLAAMPDALEAARAEITRLHEDSMPARRTVPELSDEIARLRAELIETRQWRDAETEVRRKRDAEIAALTEQRDEAMRERDEMIAAYDNLSELTLTYHGQRDRAMTLLREARGYIDPLGGTYSLALLARIDAALDAEAAAKTAPSLPETPEAPLSPPQRGTL